ncbi:MAG: amidohydrolase family protein [Spirochaetes bacterium]|nr:amidohydrolase family protein [Spirochaetota bacterium]
MKGYETVIKGGKIVYPEKTVKGNIGIKNEKIEYIGPDDSICGRNTIDAGGKYVLPGVIDPHTHPVYLDNIKGLSKTAAFGGVTTVIHYAYAKPGKSLAATLKDYIKEGEATSYIDFALHGGLFDAGKQADEIPEAVELGVTSFKMFMAYAKLGWMTDDYALAGAMDIIGRTGGMACLHAENGLVIDYIQDKLLAEKADFKERFPETSPDIAEAEAIFRAVQIGRLMKCPVYIPHISSGEGVKILKYLKDEGCKVYAETCPHYLSLTWDELKAMGSLGKVGPSIKTDKDRIALWDAIGEGYIDTIGSDHAPKDKKAEDDFFAAPYGTPEIETMLPVLWEFGVNRGRLAINRLVSVLSENTAKIMGLFPQKGRLDTGSDADIVIIDPDEEWTISQENQHSNAAYTLFEGKTILGRIKKVLSRGRLIVDNSGFSAESGSGKFIKTNAG